MCVASVRYPDGWREFRYLGRELQCGDVLTDSGDSYRVVAVEAGRHGYHDVTVELASTVKRIDEPLQARAHSDHTRPRHVSRPSLR